MSAPLSRKSGNLILGILKRFRTKYNWTFSKYYSSRQSIDCILNLSQDSSGLQDIHVNGWVLGIQKHKTVTFLQLNDGSTSGHLQVVLDHTIPDDVTCYGGSVQVWGDLIRSPGGSQHWELLASKVKVIGTSDSTYPIAPAKTKQPLNTTREFMHLRSRSKINSSILRVRNSAVMAVHKFFQTNNFIYIHTPILTSNDCEGAGEVFRVEPDQEDLIQTITDNESDGAEKNEHFFKRPVYLTVSGQLHLESSLGMFGNVYSFGPTFRAEKTKGRFHLSEFYMVEGEMAFLDNMEGLLLVMENLIKYTTDEIYRNSEVDIKYITEYIGENGYMENIRKIMDNDFKRITYTDAMTILEKKKKIFEENVEWGDNLHKEHEKYLVKHCGNVPVFVTDFPASIKPFYTLTNEDNLTACAVDLLVPDIGELFGGSLREHNHDILERKLADVGQTENLQWYLDLRKYGTVPHGGFGMGFERYLQLVTGVHNIKDTIPFPRSALNCKM